nr:hypothetical protein GCM10020092_047730 [Actinoplanes digitatis]
MRLPGYTEISAVCTDPAFRGAQPGLAADPGRVGLSIQESGAVPFLHTAATNTGAIRLYEQLGFVLRTDMEFAAYRVP